MKAIILGAGKGTRLQSEKYNIPKVLRKVKNKSLLKYVLESASFIEEKDTCIVVGYKKEDVIEEIGGEYFYATQQEQLGTGHAVMMAEEFLRDYDGDVIVLYGDMPLCKRETYLSIINKHKEMNSKCTLLTAKVENPPPYGRIIRNDKGEIIDVIEVRDCNELQININEVNVGIYVFNAKLLMECLKLLKNDNNQNEYYLTDVPKLMLQKGVKVYDYTITNSHEILGINTIEDLNFCENILGN